MTSESPITVHPITGGIGAEVGGIDLRKPIPDELAGALRDALDRYLLIVFRDQFLDVDQHYRLTEVFGAPSVNPYAPGPPEHPEMTYVIKEADERTGVFGGGWHTDMSFIEEPPNGSVLCAIQVPPFGGDTLWANQRAAWRTLPEPLKALLVGRDAIHVGKPYGVKWAPPIEEQAMKGSTRRGDPEADRERFHPAVLTHPRTGERSLYVNPTYTMRLDGLTEDESQPILARLFEHATLPELSCRLRWSAGTIAVWDNYSTQHYAIDDYAGHRREMRRITYQATGISGWRG
jgi:taurine dioxygenase